MNIENVWANYQSSLKAFLLKNLGNPHDAEDLLQEILLKSFQNLSQIKDVKKVKSWLFQIAQHTVVDFYRKRGRYSELDSVKQWQGHDDDGVYQQLSQCVLPFINELDEADASLLTAIEIEGESQKAYAKRHGIKYSTLKSRVQKSRSNLYRLFSQCCNLTLDSQGRLVDYHGKPKVCVPCQ